MRVQIPAYTDSWMKGDRYGEVVKVRKQAIHHGKPDTFVLRDVASVKLDKSGKTVRILLEDCTEI
jgi:hypothetical protein